MIFVVAVKLFVKHFTQFSVAVRLCILNQYSSPCWINKQNIVSMIYKSWVIQQWNNQERNHW